MPVSDAQARATRKYEDKAYDKTLIRMHKGSLDLIRQAAERSGESLNSFIVSAAMDKAESILQGK